MANPQKETDRIEVRVPVFNDQNKQGADSDTLTASGLDDSSKESTNLSPDKKVLSFNNNPLTFEEGGAPPVPRDFAARIVKAQDHSPRLVDWGAGARAQLEIYPAGSGSEKTCNFRYTLPWSTTIRPPVETIPLAELQFGAIDFSFKRVAELLRAGDIVRGEKSVTADKLSATAEETTEQLQILGEMLFELMIPDELIRGALKTKEVFLEIGVDDSMLEYPWELMYDGEDFLCMKNYVGRFVNSSSRLSRRGRSRLRPFDLSEELKVLLIVVSSPNVAGYPDLPQARKEKTAIEEAFKLKPNFDMKNLTILENFKATKQLVIDELHRKNRRYHIIHFCGHAEFNSEKPENSKLILQDEPLETDFIIANFSKPKPILCFINACDSLRDSSGEDRFSLYGLGSAFLETGAYLLGSRWKVHDDAAGVFAHAFYKSLVVEGKSIGEAVFRARHACRDARPDDFAWASYLLYGDPRVYFPNG